MAYSFVNTMEPEANLIARGLRQRDAEVIGHLAQQYQHRLLRYLICLAGDRSLAEDLFQETWIRVMERGHLYDGKREFSFWLFAVARNLTIDFFRRRRDVSLDGLLADDRHDFAEPADTHPLAWEVLARREQIDRVHAALLELPAEYREAVVLRFQEEMSLNEIAALIAVPLGTVKSRLYRGLNLLMQRAKEGQS